MGLLNLVLTGVPKWLIGNFIALAVFVPSALATLSYTLFYFFLTRKQLLGLLLVTSVLWTLSRQAITIQDEAARLLPQILAD